MMQEILLQNYSAFSSQIASLTFHSIQSKFIDHQNQDKIGKYVGDYVPKFHQYQHQFDSHRKELDAMRKVPAFNGKKEFDNIDNMHRKVMEIFKNFIKSQIKDFREYLRLTLDVDLLSQILSRIEVLRFKNSEWMLIYYLFIASKRSIRIFLKLRQQIVKIYTFMPQKYMPISTHNSAKYKERYHYIDKITVSRKKKEWQDLIFLAGFQYDDEFTSYIFNLKDEIPSVDLINYCLWLNRQTASQSSSPTK